ncbi:MAG: OmpA family protein [Candidatus Methylomirabilales bacterium]
MVKHLFHRKILLLLLTVPFASGCATVKYVKEQLGMMDEKIAQESEARQQQVDAITARLDAMEGKFSRKFANRNMYDVRETRAVYFDFNKAELKDAAITTLVEVGRILKEDPNTLVELEGHTDAVGPTLYNLHLSRERAASVVRHLVHNFGIGTRRISWVGFGKETPVADNNSEEGRAKNRRVTMRILTPKVGAESVAQSK